MGRVSGKVALLTGGASGIGQAAATLLAREGARVVLGDINQESGPAVAEAIGFGARFVKLDVTSEKDWVAALAEVQRAFGRLDVLVNSAGVALVADVEETTLAEWRRVHAINLDGTFLGCKHGIGLMKQGGGGSIVNLSSVSGIIGGHNVAAYNSSKAGVRLLTKSVALHCARAGYRIRCNSVHPTFINTPMLDEMLQRSKDPDKTRRALVQQVPLGRLGEPDDVAYGILYLASDESAFVTGTEFVIDGGCTAM